MRYARGMSFELAIFCALGVVVWVAWAFRPRPEDYDTSHLRKD